jgi:hypothetical protein
LVAIAKDEGKFIAEWIAYHLSIGVDRICIYVNDSSDSTELIVSKLSRYYPVVMVDWPSLNHKSPQLAAYADALKRFGNTKWMGFWDIDEFIVPYGYKDLPDFLRSVPEGTSAIGINARSFGSSGVTDPDYPSVLHTFRRCSLPEHYANRHIKTLVRPTAVRRMHIHHADMRSGQSVNSGFEPLVSVETGKIAEPVFNGVQINHYQVKTWSEYEARRRKGNANFNPKHTSHVRKLTAKGFQAGDRNELEDESLLPFLQAFDSLHREVARAIEGQLTLRQRLRRIRFMAFNGLDPVVHKARNLRNRLLRKLAHASGRRRR